MLFYFAAAPQRQRTIPRGAAPAVSRVLASFRIFCFFYWILAVPAFLLRAFDSLVSLLLSVVFVALGCAWRLPFWLPLDPPGAFVPSGFPWRLLPLLIQMRTAMPATVPAH